MSQPATRTVDPVTTESTGPVFVSGRQFSGNTLMTVVLGRHHTCWSQSKENLFFERRDLFDKIEDPIERAKAVAE